MDDYALGRRGSKLILAGENYQERIYQIRVLKDTVFSELKSGGEELDGETTPTVDQAPNFGVQSPRVVPAGDIITANGDDFFTKVVITSGSVRCYNA